MPPAEYDAFAAFYDLEYGHKENDLDFYLDVAEESGGPILEIGVGTGRVAMDLAANGFEVVGLDNSPEMLRLATINLETLKPEERSRVHLHQADMRHFSLGRQFPLVIIPFRAFLHNLTMDDQLATLTCIKNHLEPKGILAFDLFVPLYSLMAQKKWHDKIDHTELSDTTTEISIDIQVEHQAANQLLTITNTYVDEKQHSRHSASMAYRYIFRYEMEALLRCAGYTVMNVYGGFEDQPYNFDSGIMVFIAQVD